MFLKMTLTLDSHSIPRAHISIITNMAMIPTSRMESNSSARIEVLYLSRRRSLRDSQNPMVFKDADTAFAKASTMPTEAPNSGPSDREIIK